MHIVGATPCGCPALLGERPSWPLAGWKPALLGPLSQIGTAQGSEGPPSNVMCITRPKRGQDEKSSRRCTRPRLHRLIPADEVIPGRIELKRPAVMRGLQADKQHDVGD